tara:strand:- start:273 stop:542 length:270 start_codon:yes stop_codon:yes gene_type:complete
VSFRKIELTSEEWTLIHSGMTSVSFHNVGLSPIYINSTLTDIAPTDEVGFMYASMTGERMMPIIELTKSGGGYIWAKSASERGAIIVEE